MRKYLFILMALTGVVSGCEGVSPVAEDLSDNGMMTLFVEPQFGDMDVEVKSLEIGKDDIMCIIYDSEGNLVEGSPFMPSAIDGSMYRYDVPAVSSGHCHFVVWPEGTEPHLDGNGLYIKDSYAVVEKREIYMSGVNSGHAYSNGIYYSYIYSYGYSLNTSAGKVVSFGTVRMSQCHKLCHMKLQFNGIPEGYTPETYIKSINLAFGRDEINTFLVMDDLSEVDGIWWTKDIYLHYGWDVYQKNSSNMMITVETVTGDILKNTLVSALGWLYDYHEETFKITLDLSE